MDVHLLDERARDSVGNIETLDGTATINFFSFYVDLAVFRGTMYSSLYSVKFQKQSRGA